MASSPQNSILNTKALQKYGKKNENLAGPSENENLVDPSKIQFKSPSYIKVDPNILDDEFDKEIIKKYFQDSNPPNLEIIACNNLSTFTLEKYVMTTYKTQMTMFRLKKLASMNNEVLTKIVDSPKLLNLTHLDFSGNYYITDIGVLTIATDPKMKTLISLNFSDCNQLTNDSIISIFKSKNLISLKKLKIKKLPYITDDAIKKLIHSDLTKNLITLAFEKCSSLTSKSLEYLFSEENNDYVANISRIALPIDWNEIYYYLLNSKFFQHITNIKLYVQGRNHVPEVISRLSNLIDSQLCNSKYLINLEKVKHNHNIFPINFLNSDKCKNVIVFYPKTGLKRHKRKSEYFVSPKKYGIFICEKNQKIEKVNYENFNTLLFQKKTEDPVKLDLFGIYDLKELEYLNFQTSLLPQEIHPDLFVITRIQKLTVLKIEIDSPISNDLFLALDRVNFVRLNSFYLKITYKEDENAKGNKMDLEPFYQSLMLEKVENLMIDNDPSFFSKLPKRKLNLTKLKKLKIKGIKIRSIIWPNILILARSLETIIVVPGWSAKQSEFDEIKTSLTEKMINIYGLQAEMNMNISTETMGKSQFLKHFNNIKLDDHKKSIALPENVKANIDKLMGVLQKSIEISSSNKSPVQTQQNPNTMAIPIFEYMKEYEIDKEEKLYAFDTLKKQIKCLDSLIINTSYQIFTDIGTEDEQIIAESTLKSKIGLGKLTPLIQASKLLNELNNHKIKQLKLSADLSAFPEDNFNIKIVKLELFDDFFDENLFGDIYSNLTYFEFQTSLPGKRILHWILNTKDNTFHALQTLKISYFIWDNEDTSTIEFDYLKLMPKIINKLKKLRFLEIRNEGKDDLVEGINFHNHVKIISDDLKNDTYLEEFYFSGTHFHIPYQATIEKSLNEILRSIDQVENVSLKLNFLIRLIELTEDKLNIQNFQFNNYNMNYYLYFKLNEEFNLDPSQLAKSMRSFYLNLVASYGDRPDFIFEEDIFVNSVINTNDPEFFKMIIASSCKNPIFLEFYSKFENIQSLKKEFYSPLLKIIFPFFTQPQIQNFIKKPENLTILEADHLNDIASNLMKYEIQNITFDFAFLEKCTKVRKDEYWNILKKNIKIEPTDISKILIETKKKIDDYKFPSKELFLSSLRQDLKVKAYNAVLKNYKKDFERIYELPWDVLSKITFKEKEEQFDSLQVLNIKFFNEKDTQSFAGSKFNCAICKSEKNCEEHGVYTCSKGNLTLCIDCAKGKSHEFRCGNNEKKCFLIKKFGTFETFTCSRCSILVSLSQEQGVLYCKCPWILCNNCENDIIAGYPKSIICSKKICKHISSNQGVVYSKSLQTVPWDFSKFPKLEVLMFDGFDLTPLSIEILFEKLKDAVNLKTLELINLTCTKALNYLDPINLPSLNIRNIKFTNTSEYKKNKMARSWDDINALQFLEVLVKNSKLRSLELELTNILNKEDDNKINQELVNIIGTKQLSKLVMKGISLKNITYYIHIFQSESIIKQSLQSLDLDIPNLNNDHLEIISKSNKLTKLKYLKIDCSTIDKANRHLIRLIGFDQGMNSIISSETLNLDWKYFLNNNNKYFSDTSINQLIAKRKVFETIDILDLSDSSNISFRSIIKILKLVDPAVFDLKVFLDNHAGLPFMTIEVYLTIFGNIEKKSRFEIMGKKDIILVNDNYPVHMFLLNRIKDGNFNYKAFLDIMIDKKNNISLDDNFIDILCHFKKDFQAQQIFVILQSAQHEKVTNEGINKLVQHLSPEEYENGQSLPNLYFWILLDNHWRQMINYHSLNIITNFLEDSIYTNISILDFSGNECLFDEKLDFLNLEMKNLLLKSKKRAKSIEDEEIDALILQKKKFGHQMHKANKAVLQIIEKCKNLETLILDNQLFGDELCEKISILLSDPKLKTGINFISLKNNSRITSVGNKFLYTTIVGYNSLRGAVTSCEHKFQKPYVEMLNNGLHQGLIVKFEQYKAEYRNLGLGCYDHVCFIMVFYTIICCPIACYQLFYSQLRNNHFIRRIIDTIVNKIESIKQKLGVSGKEIYYEHFKNEIEQEIGREKFIFTVGCINLNALLKSKWIWGLLLFIMIGYYFICFFCPIYFIIPHCNNLGHLWASHIIYGSFAALIFLFELILNKLMAKEINNETIIGFGAGSLVSLLSSQITKLSLYTNMLFMTITFQCGSYTVAILSAISIGIQNFWNIAHSMMTFYEYITIKEKNTHYSTYINMLAKISYNLEITGVSEVLERLSTSSTVKVHNIFIAQIILKNLIKFTVENLPHSILQIYSLLTNTTQDFGSITTIISLFTSLYVLFSAFYSAINNKPSICTSEMLGTISPSKYQESFIELDLKPMSFTQRIKNLFLKDSKGSKDSKISQKIIDEEENSAINPEMQEKVILLEDYSSERQLSGKNTPLSFEISSSKPK